MTSQESLERFFLSPRRSAKPAVRLSCRRRSEKFARRPCKAQCGRPTSAWPSRRTPEPPSESEAVWGRFKEDHHLAVVMGLIEGGWLHQPRNSPRVLNAKHSRKLFVVKVGEDSRAVPHTHVSLERVLANSEPGGFQFTYVITVCKYTNHRWFLETQVKRLHQITRCLHPGLLLCTAKRHPKRTAMTPYSPLAGLQCPGF